MKEIKTIPIKDYLNRKGIVFREQNGELLVKCLFNECDSDSRINEAHLYFSIETGQYHCKKCDSKGNILTLAELLGDSRDDVIIRDEKPRAKSSPKDISHQIEVCHENLPTRIRTYLHSRGLQDEIINRYKLGYGHFYNKNWITIPRKNKDGEYVAIKLRSDPEDNNSPNRFMNYPNGVPAGIYGYDSLKQNKEHVCICEGELDRLVMVGQGIPTITSTGGASTFKDEWIESLSTVKNIYVLLDKDEAGEQGAQSLIKKLSSGLPLSRIFKLSFPERMKEGKDITDYFSKSNGSVHELMESARQVAGRRPIDSSKFKEISSEKICEILGKTIKKDEENKLTTFLCLLSAYTDNCQFNISYNAPSSTGKSFIPLEISNLFPKEDLMKLGNCSPTAFFHEQGVFDKEKNTITVDLSRKIIIFLDQPNSLLLERLRSLLSHDQKEMVSKITDKSSKGGNRTKNVIIIGFPAVVFCSAGLLIDEQEGTRFILLSPDTGQEKIRQSVLEKIKREVDKDTYLAQIESDSDILLLKERIEAIRDAHIKEIIIPNPKLIEKAFLTNKTTLKPRHQRDIGRFTGLVKLFALLNLWFREKREDSIVANEDDINEAAVLWELISESQEYGLPPYALKFYKDLILKPSLGIGKSNDIEVETLDGKMGLSKKDITSNHYSIYGRHLSVWELTQKYLPMLESSGLIEVVRSMEDKRVQLIYPIIDFNK